VLFPYTLFLCIVILGSDIAEKEPTQNFNKHFVKNFAYSAPVLCDLRACLPAGRRKQNEDFDDKLQL
ncbi:hypothetical protein, partial [Daejeonella sp.]|uniref:hypothetical protein n=1 Tax=Daejeonella sp. TaxID=2805397 RepID=UPI0030BB5206